VDADDELRDIKREIVESRSLIIKASNLVAGLGADLKAVSRRQTDGERRAVWSSVGANLLVLVVILAAVKVAWDAQREGLRAEEKRLTERVEKLTADQKARDERDAARLKAEGAAASFYELVRAERRQEVLDGWEAVRKEPLSRAEQAFLGDAVARAKAELSLQRFHQGVENARLGRSQEAATKLEDALRLDPGAAHAPQTKLALARVYRKLGRARDALPKLTELSEASPDKEVMDDAALLLAECLVDLESWTEAKAALRTFLKRFPDSPLASDARVMLSEISTRR
jgi:TolA-binding protein